MSVTGTRLAGGTNLAGSWGAGTSPGSGGRGPRGGVPPFSLHPRGALGTVLSAGRAGGSSRTGSLSPLSRALGELVLLPQQLSLGLHSPVSIHCSSLFISASNPCGFHSTSRTVSHKSQGAGAGGGWRGAGVGGTLWSSPPCPPRDPTESGGRLSVREEAAPESWSFLAGLPRVAGARRAGCLPAEIWGLRGPTAFTERQPPPRPESDTWRNEEREVGLTGNRWILSPVAGDADADAALTP